MKTYSYRVNVLNKQQKECWKYCMTLARAVNLREIGKQQGLSSNIHERTNGKWTFFPF